MKKNSVSLGVMAALLATGGLAFQGALAQDGDDEFIEEIVTTGTRSAKPRSASDSPVPVDVLSADDFTAMGNTADLTDNIKALVPRRQRICAPDVVTRHSARPDAGPYKWETPASLGARSVPRAGSRQRLAWRRYRNGSKYGCQAR
jgi:hypothetical protein